jgi:hypothetical protein
LSIQGGHGGLLIQGYGEGVSAPILDLIAHGDSGAGTTAKSTAATAFVMIRATEGGPTTPIGADENILAVSSYNTTRFILDADGDSHQDVGTAWTNFDDHDDLALLHALSAGVSRVDDPLRLVFADFLEQHRETLTRQRIVTFNDDGHPFINWSRAHMLTVGAVRQIGMQQLEILKRLDALEAVA